MHAYVYIYIYIYTNTNIYIYVYTCIYVYDSYYSIWCVVIVDDIMNYRSVIYIYVHVYSCLSLFLSAYVFLVFLYIGTIPDDSMLCGSQNKTETVTFHLSYNKNGNRISCMMTRPNDCVVVWDLEDIVVHCGCHDM